MTAAGEGPPMWFYSYFFYGQVPRVMQMLMQPPEPSFALPPMATRRRRGRRPGPGDVSDPVFRGVRRSGPFRKR